MIGFCPGLIFAFVAVLIASWPSRKYLAGLQRISESELLNRHSHLRSYVAFYKIIIVVSFFISFLIFAGLFFSLLVVLAPTSNQAYKITEVAFTLVFPYMVLSYAIANGIFELKIGLTGIGEKQNIWHHFSGIGKGKGNPYCYLYGDEVRYAGKFRVWLSSLFIVILLIFSAFFVWHFMTYPGGF